ncbi:MAG: hypothetical protein JO093_12100 [Acidobacteria bacterium]|jgi:hypothetical protein|nr:hypothetical protein [Acidobacteriota bacterium]MBV9069091.1 hypothetical protein [Acidobacteriota bacterium]MBV9186361.1 hypothetical protein [Acidobacteriota bacterium]
MITERLSSDYVEMRFGPRWTYISCVRRFVASFFMIGLSDKERAEQISMAASELLENAVKYASEEEGYLKISIAKADNEVDVCVKNKAEPHHINTLRRELALIQSGQPEAVYLKKMEEAAMTEGQSRLGLIRILFEAGARLRLEVNDGEVSIHAIFKLEAA